MDALQLARLVLAFAVSASETSPGYARSDNFVVFAPVQELADEVLLKAELFRREIAQDWLAKELPKGLGMASIHVRLADNADQGDTWITEHPDTACHVMRLTTDGKMIPSALHHEVTHVVLGTRFGGKIARWVEEGTACIGDSEEYMAQRRRFVDTMAANRDWIDVRSLFTTQKLGSTDVKSYAVATSLTHFFLERGDKARFLSFAQSGLADGWDKALRRHYNIADTDALQRLWQDWTVTVASQGTVGRGLRQVSINPRRERSPPRMRPK